MVAEACVETNDLSDYDRRVLATERSQVCVGGFPNRRPNLGMERPYLRLAAFCLGHRIKIV